MEKVTFRPNFEDWQRMARRALQRELAPNECIWQELLADQPSLDMFDEPEVQNAGETFRVPKAFVELARAVALHRDDRRWALFTGWSGG